MEMETFNSLEKEEKAKDFKTYIEKVFWQILKRYKYLYKDIIKKYYSDDLHIWFETPVFTWNENNEIKIVHDDRGKALIEFICDLEVSGTICLHNIIEKFPATFYVTVRVLQYPNSTIFHQDHIFFWTKEQKALLNFNNFIFERHKALGFKGIENNKETDYSSFVTLWKKVQNKNATQAHTTSHNYFIEIQFAYEQLMFLISNMQTYGQYTSSYIANEIPANGKIIYQAKPSLFDKRYLEFCSLSFQKLYDFWERISFLIYQFLPPSKLQSKKLSFYSLIDNLKKDVSSGKFGFLKLPNSNFIWFSDFEANEHKEMREYRHPQTHYQIQNDIYKGGFYAGTYTYWLDNVYNKGNLQKLQKSNEELSEFLVEQFKLCSVGFEKAIALINEMP